MNNPSTDFEAKTAGVPRAQDHPEWISDPMPISDWAEEGRDSIQHQGVGLRTRK